MTAGSLAKAAMVASFRTSAAGSALVVAKRQSGSPLDATSGDLNAGGETSVVAGVDVDGVAAVGAVSAPGGKTGRMAVDGVAAVGGVSAPGG